MSHRRDRDDVADQLAHLARSREDAARAFEDVAEESKRMVKAFRSKRGTPDASAWAGAVSAARRAEEAFDLAVLDLATARGEDA